MTLEQGPQNNALLRLIQSAIGWLEKFERAVLTLLLATMILLASYQILLRWFTSGGLLWIDPFLRYLVLWAGMIGAAYATSRGNHISMDIVSYLVPPRVNRWLKLAALSFSVLVTVFLFRASILFIQSEMVYGGTSLFGLQSWTWNLIFPLAFCLILLHFLLSLLLGCVDIVTTSPENSSQKKVTFDA